jgi:hypothetical protein
MRMGNLLVLGWWLALLAGLQCSALTLDRFHHLEWGRLGMHLIKACYLGFACVLFMRFLSFRSQKHFETLVESYNRLSKQAVKPEKIRKDGWLNPFLLLVLVVLTSANFTLVFQWNEPVLKLSVWLDFIIWALIIRWLGRTFWLKGNGARERLKEVLDDARSRSRSASAEPVFEERRNSRTPYAVLAGASLALALALSAKRWIEVRDVFKVDDLKACMEKCMRKAAVRFYQQGELQIDVEGEPCVLQRRGQVDMTLDFKSGDLRLNAFEAADDDYFGNGRNGDQGLVLDAVGRFRKAFIPAAQEPVK